MASLKKKLKKRSEALKKTAESSEAAVAAIDLFKRRKERNDLGIGDINALSPFQLKHARDIIKARELNDKGLLDNDSFRKIVKTFNDGIVLENKELRNLQ